jgi:NAD/NADP transhydrogenase beta subunit
VKPGFAGIENKFFLRDNTMMIFVDTKKSLQDLVAYIKG